MTNEVVVNSAGFPAIYLIELKSRTKHEDFSITFGSARSAVLSKIEVENFNDIKEGDVFEVYIMEEVKK